MSYQHILDLCHQMSGWDPRYSMSQSAVTAQEIALAQSDLGFTLCDEYIELLSKLGYLEVGDNNFIGLKHGTGRREDDNDFVGATWNFEKNHLSISEMTVFMNESDEWFHLIDHARSEVVFYDPFSKEIIRSGKGIIDYLTQYITDRL